MTDEERIARAAEELLERQQRDEAEETDQRLKRLLADQRRQLLLESDEVRGEMEKQMEVLRERLAEAEKKLKAKPVPKVEPLKSDKEGKGKNEFSNNMRIKAEDFFNADDDGSSELDRDEFSKMYTEACKRDGKDTPTDDEVNALFDKLDQVRASARACTCPRPCACPCACATYYMGW